MWHAYAQDMWYTGSHETDDALRFATNEPLPPGDWSGVPTEGQPWPQWQRYAWGLAAYAAPWRRVWQAVKQERERRRVGGIRVAQQWFHTDDSTRGRLASIAALADADVPTELKLKTIDGVLVTLTATNARQLLKAIAAKEQLIYNRAEELKAALVAAVDPFSVDIHTGWPAVYDSPPAQEP